jgi:hypothetical protein
VKGAEVKCVVTTVGWAVIEGELVGRAVDSPADPEGVGAFVTGAAGTNEGVGLNVCGAEGRGVKVGDMLERGTALPRGEGVPTVGACGAKVVGV